MSFNDKPKTLQEVIDNFSERAFGRKTSESIASSICTICGSTVIQENFRDTLSLQEYKISGMCQICQDRTYQEYDVQQDYDDCYEDY